MQILKSALAESAIAALSTDYSSGGVAVLSCQSRHLPKPPLSPPRNVCAAVVTA